MLVRDHMTGKVITIDADRPVARQPDCCCATAFASCPVLRDGQLVGIITHRDLRARAAAHQDGGGAMTAKPFTIGPDAAVDEAARRLRTYKIGGLPVVDGKQLVGIITVADVLDALVTLSGVTEPTYRLVVSGRGGAQMEARARRVVDRAHGQLKWLHRDPSQRPQQLHLRVKVRRIDALVDALEAEGFDVVRIVAAARTT